jgi:putative DNA primase/helicase
METPERLFEAPAAPPAPVKGKVPVSIQFSDAGNGELLVAEHGDSIRYVNDERGWRLWDGVRWNADKTQEIARLAKETVRRILEKAVQAESLDLREALSKWSLGCESRSRLENMVALASREQKVSTNSCYFDVSPWLLNCANGTIDLETNTFRPAKREDLLSKQSPVSYDPKARCPRFDAFLEEILPSPEIRNFLQASLGYTLCGHAWEKYVWFLIGGGDNGKTVLIETIRYVFGEDDYATNMNFNSLLHREGQGPSGDIARLRGARFVSACESDQGQKISPALLKRLSGGGDKITASFKYRDEFEFVPTHKLWLATNHPPQLAAEDDALWRRIARVPFNVRIPLEKQDSRLQEKLKLEGPGILNWMFEGWKAYRANGLKLPAEVREETERYRDASDVCKDFLVDRVVAGGGSIGSTRLYQAFKSWFGDTHNQRQQPMSQKMFSTRLDQLGYQIEKKRDGNVICGIGRLISDPIPEQTLF